MAELIGSGGNKDTAKIVSNVRKLPNMHIDVAKVLERAVVKNKLK